MMYLWLEVTQDRYELPVAVFDTAWELARYENMRKETITSAIYRYEEKGYNTKFRRVRA